MKWQKQEAIFGPPPKVGDKVYVDFGDSVQAPPETRDVVTYIGDKGVALEHGARRYNWFEIAHIEVVT
jgi:hypothetical protein